MITVDIKPSAVWDFPSAIFSNTRILPAILHVHSAYVHMADYVPVHRHVLSNHKPEKKYIFFLSPVLESTNVNTHLYFQALKVYQSYGPTQVCFKNVTSTRIQVELILSCFLFPPEVGWKSLQENSTNISPNGLLQISLFNIKQTDLNIVHTGNNGFIPAFPFQYSPHSRDGLIFFFNFQAQLKMKFNYLIFLWEIKLSKCRRFSIFFSFLNYNINRYLAKLRQIIPFFSLWRRL